MAVGGRNSHLANAPAASKSIGNYLLSKTVGEGTFGKVKLGVHLLTGERVAVKVLEKDRIVDKGDIKRVTREIQILKHIRHPNVVHLLEVIEKPKHIQRVEEGYAGTYMPPQASKQLPMATVEATVSCRRSSSSD